MIPPSPPQGPGVSQPPTAGARDSKVTTLAITMLVLGVLVCCGGACIAASPIALFVLGGGGDTEGFEEFARGPEILGTIFMVLSGLPFLVAAGLFIYRDK